MSFLALQDGAKEGSGRVAIGHVFLSGILRFYCSNRFIFLRSFVLDLLSRTMKHGDGAQFVWVTGVERRSKNSNNSFFQISSEVQNR